jgi:hypothetical protein
MVLFLHFRATYKQKYVLIIAMLSDFYVFSGDQVINKGNYVAKGDSRMA